MGWLEQAVHDAGLYLSRVLGPVTIGIDLLDGMIQHQMTLAGVPFNLQSPIITGLWAVVIVMVLRTVTGWGRLVALVATAVVLAKVFSLLPVA